MRHQFEVREFTAPQLVENLTWLSISVRIIVCGLKRAKELQRCACEMRINQNVLQRDNQAVSSKRRDKPRKSGGRHEGPTIGNFYRETKRSHVLQGTPKHTIKLLVAGPNLRNSLQPLCHHLPCCDSPLWSMQPRGGLKRAAPSSNVYSRQVCHRPPGWRSTSKLRRPFA